jgi:protein ImuA
MHMIPPTLDRASLLAALRARVARLERGAPGPAPEPLSLCPVLDAGLPQGGLARGGLHDLTFPPEEAAGAATGFAAVLLGRAGGHVFWIAEEPDAWPPGLARFGLDPAALVLVRARGADALWAMEEALRSPAAAGALLVLTRPPDLTAERRLMLAAQTGGGIGLLLRPESGEAPGAALTRWRVASLPGRGAARHDLGDPCWQVELLRCRGGRPGAWVLSWSVSAGALRAEEGTEPEPSASSRRRA